MNSFKFVTISITEGKTLQENCAIPMDKSVIISSGKSHTDGIPTKNVRRYHLVGILIFVGNSSVNTDEHISSANTDKRIPSVFIYNFRRCISVGIYREYRRREFVGISENTDKGCSSEYSGNTDEKSPSVTENKTDDFIPSEYHENTDGSYSSEKCRNSDGYFFN